MSWSLSGTGPAAQLLPQIAKQVAAVNLNDPGEMESVRLVGELLAQTLGTFDPDKPVSVQASGSMGYKDWQAKTGPFQSYKIEVMPIHFST